MSIRRHFGATLMVSLLTVLAATVRNVLFGNVYGASAETDAFFVSFLWFRMFLEDMPSMLLPNLMPAYVESVQSGSSTTMRRTFFRLLRGGAVQFSVFLLILLISAPLFVRWTTTGLSPEAFELASQMYYCCLLLSPLLFLSCFFRMHLEARRRFAASAQFRAIIWCVSSVCLCLAPWLGIWAAVAGLAMGVVAGLLVAGWLVLSDVGKFDALPEDETRSRASITAERAVHWSSAILFLSIILQRAAGLLDMHFGSLIAPGAISIYALAGAVVSLPVVLIAQSASTVVGPRAAEFRISEDSSQLSATLHALLATLGGGALAGGLCLCLTSGFVARLLFGHGAFSEAGLAEMSGVLQLFAWSILPLCIQYGCMSMAVTLCHPALFVALPALAITARYAFLNSYGPDLTIDGLVYSHILYHSIWAVGLSAALLYRLRRVPATDSLNGASVCEGHAGV